MYVIYINVCAKLTINPYIAKYLFKKVLCVVIFVSIVAKWRLLYALYEQNDVQEVLFVVYYCEKNNNFMQ